MSATDFSAYKNDSDLLSAFIEQRSESAFAEIMRRHSGMVLSVCRAILGNTSDAEDATQAVFLTLAQKASSMRNKILAGWLHRVSWYVATRAARSNAARRRHEQEAARMRPTESKSSEKTIPADILHAGLADLPEKYRVPILLHFMEGKTQAQTAETIGCGESAAAMRINRGRMLLRDKLSRRGVLASSNALAAALASQTSAKASPVFVAAAAKAASAIAIGNAVYVASISSRIMSLSKGAMNMLFWANIKIAGITAMLILLAGGIIGIYSTLAEPPKTTDSSAAAPATASQPANAQSSQPAKQTRSDISQPPNAPPPIKWIWWEGENAKETNYPQNSQFAPQGSEQQKMLSGGAWLQTGKGVAGRKLFAKYEITVETAGEYNLWARVFYHHGPFRWRFDEQEWQICDEKIPLADSVDIRPYLCVNWKRSGNVKLSEGKHAFQIELLAAEGKDTPSAFDCFLLINGDFTPRGVLKPDEKFSVVPPDGWFVWQPEYDSYDEAYVDIGKMSSRQGIPGRVTAKGNDFIYPDGSTARFWGINIGADIVRRDRNTVRAFARFLAKRGVNLVRIQTAIHDLKNPDRIDEAFLDQVHFFVSVMKDAGIYVKFSTYYPSLFTLTPEYKIPGFTKNDGKNPNSILYFCPRMQELYRTWTKEFLARNNPYTDIPLAKDPAVLIFEIVNEDTFFWWGFDPYRAIPAECMQPLEAAFGAWLARKYGSLDKARQTWGPEKYPETIKQYTDAGMKPDDWENGFIRLYGAGHLCSFEWAVGQRNPQRAQDQLQFLTEQMREFFAGMQAWLKKDVGFEGCVTGNNWNTIDPLRLDPLEKYANTVCDVMDRHAYLDGTVKAHYPHTRCVADGDTFKNQTILLTPELSIIREIRYDGHPHIFSEFNWDFPNRYRPEMPLIIATYSLLQGTSAVVFNATRASGWENQFKGYFQIATPEVMGQFFGASLIYRNGYLKEGPIVFNELLNLKDLYAFKGSKAVAAVNQDPQRFKDVPAEGMTEISDATLDPLTFLVGRVTRGFTDKPASTQTANLMRYIDRDKKIVKSATGELTLDFGNGLLLIDAPCAQGVVGFLQKAGQRQLADVDILGQNEFGAIMAISMDGKPLKTSDKVLLQVMSEARNLGWQTRPDENGVEKIVSVGNAPICIRNFAGTVCLKRPDAGSLKVIALDANGYKTKSLPNPSSESIKIDLLPDVLYYVIQK